jgi:hypothetical protein
MTSRAVATSDATISQSGPVSSTTPTQPLPPVYGGRKKRSGSASISCACAPGGAARCTERCGLP